MSIGVALPLLSAMIAACLSLLDGVSVAGAEMVFLKRSLRLEASTGVAEMTGSAKKQVEVVMFVREKAESGKCTDLFDLD